MESVQTSSQRSPAAAQSVRHAKGAGKAAGADGLSPTPGQGPQDAFAALLGALGEGDSLVPPEPGAEAASASTTLALTDPPAQGLAAAMGWTPTLWAAQAGKMDAGTPGQAAASALSTLASSVTAGGAGALSRLAEGLAAPGEGPLGRALMEGAAVADGLVAQTALLDKGGELSQLRSAVSATVLSAAAQARARGMAQAASLGGVAAVPGLATASGAAPASASSVASALGVQATAQLGQLEQRLQAAALQVHEQVKAVHDVAASLSDPAWAATAQELLPERLAPDAGMGELQSPVAQQPGTLLSAGGEPLDHATHAVPDGSGVAADASQAAAEEQLAEQVAFWVNQQTQSAEMTLDRDGQPVQVRVELTGNEARITFLSDQAQTREALDAGMAQLRELLEQQGMVLAGVTVGGGGAAGTSAQGQGGGAEGRPAGRPSGRAPVAVPTAETAPVRHTPTGSHPGVDLFV